MNEALNYIYKMKNYIIMGIILLTLNIIILSYSQYRGCYDVTFTNILRLDVLCNACISILYHVQNVTLNIYMVIGAYVIKKVGNMVDSVTKKCNIE
jgi:hypothetical protein